MSNSNRSRQSVNHEQNMQEVIDFAQGKNKIWPFAAAIATKEGRILCQSTDCAHISPLFHAETLAIHALVTNGLKNKEGLILYSTTEPDLLALTTLCWVQVTHDLKFDTLVYGTPSETIQKLWSFSLNMPIEKFQNSINSLKIIGSVLEEPCTNLFNQAKKQQIALNEKHPGRSLSHEVSDFYTLLL